MKKSIKIGIMLFTILSFMGCQKEIDEYFYKDTEEFVDTELLNLLKQKDEYSAYVSLLEAYNIDTLFEKGNSLTFFIPANSAMESMSELYLDTIDLIKYLISESYINVAHIHGSKKIQTSSGKFALIKTSGETASFNEAEITAAGPLCKDGKYYEISNVAQPLPNLYEYINLTNTFFKSYIDLKDSSFLDLGLSTPIGYDSEGKTIYDTVLTTVNVFEEEFFPVSEEFRSKKATMLLFTQEQFDNAIYLIAEDLGLPSVENIPVQWKNDILMPYLIEQGTFWNDLSIQDFMPGILRNIRGDSVEVVVENIDFNSSFECSNGRVFNYLDFTVPDSIYKGTNIVQGEHLVISKGSDLYTWADDLIIGGAPVDPLAQLNINADNDSVLVVRFDEDNYSKDFSMTLRYKNVFPGTYRLLIRAKTIPSGVFQILVNGEVQQIDLGYGSSDRIDFYDLRNTVKGLNEIFRVEDGFNKFDILVENITEYGDVDVTLSYVEPGQRSDNGFIIDYFLLENYNR
ncbi:MAG: fasciclin domain-containing protein [Bacteroidales bacterium]|nr:fasciclin domain-containing protein [Bacteroidales bacterium]